MKTSVAAEVPEEKKKVYINPAQKMEN